MKENWTYKKLGEVGEIVTGNTPSTKDEENYSSNDYCFVKPSDICVDRISRIVETEFYVSKTGFQHSRRLPQGSVLTTCIGIIGKVGILQKEATCNQQINAIVPSSIVSSEYLAYAIFGLRSELELMANAPVVPIINKGSFSNFTIPVPPIETQSRIVSELDLLQSIMDKQQAQLKELDKLAQAVFYDMFGDPVENEKGWEMQNLEKVCLELFAGGDVPKDCCSPVKTADYQIPIISNGIGERAIYGYTNRAKVFDESVTISGRGTIGYCEVRTEPFFPVVRLIVGVPNKTKVLPVFLKYVIDAHHLNGIGVAIPQLTIPMVKSLGIIFPPLSLQQSFAAKIESIEKQKAAISQSIAEMQELFDYTMDKYFG